MAANRRAQAEIDRAAAAWLIRLGRPALAETDRRAFRAWLDADPAHAAAFEEARSLWDGLGPTAARVETAVLGRARRRLALAAAVCLGIALGAVLLRSGADVATPHGTVETVALADGSRMTLDGDSAADLRLDPALRRVTLRRGRAFFDVAPDPGRPFVVVAGTVETAVRGTAFSVERQGDTVAVVVERGRVAVTDGAGATAEVAAGQRIEAGAAPLGPPGPASLAAALAWRRGLMVFEDRTLGEVAAALDRATGAPVLIPQPAVRALRLSGVFRGDRPAAVLDAIEAGLGVRIVRLGLATVILD